MYILKQLQGNSEIRKMTGFKIKNVYSKMVEINDSMWSNYTQC